jgi:hypothetical protein
MGAAGVAAASALYGLGSTAAGSGPSQSLQVSLPTAAGAALALAWEEALIAMAPHATARLNKANTRRSFMVQAT